VDRRVVMSFLAGLVIGWGLILLAWMIVLWATG
jgi:hypothetical protein